MASVSVIVPRPMAGAYPGAIDRGLFMNKSLLAIVVLVFLLFVVFVWPTLYRYEKLSGNSPYSVLKINRITGDTMGLHKYGRWCQIP